MRCMVSDVILLGFSTSVSSEVIFESIMDAENVNFRRVLHETPCWVILSLIAFRNSSHATSVRVLLLIHPFLL